jgi:hypothetical protein
VFKRPVVMHCCSIKLLLTSTGACDVKSCEGLKKVFEDDCMCVPVIMAVMIAVAVAMVANIDDVPVYATYSFG